MGENRVPVHVAAQQPQMQVQQDMLPEYGTRTRDC
jgi:hypothetical protein